jgi:hypothetical protein
MAKQLRNYIYIDEDHLQKLAEQMADELPNEASTDELKVSLGVLGQKIERSRKSIVPVANSHQKIQALTRVLWSGRQLTTKRPPRMVAPGTRDHIPFVLESTVARKVILPHASKAVPGMRELAVWIGDPDPSDFSDEQWDYAGTFLYLVQSHWDLGAYQTVHSGCSALQAVVNRATCRTGLSADPKELLGRGNNLHPVDKLVSLGGIPGQPRKIVTLYRCRYMTNEQVYAVGGSDRRVNDLLAYPIFIAE